jgi:hypothetical protein
MPRPSRRRAQAARRLPHGPRRASPARPPDPASVPPPASRMRPEMPGRMLWADRGALVGTAGTLYVALLNVLLFQQGRRWSRR